MLMKRLVGGLLLAATVMCANAANPQVRTADGTVRGVLRDGVQRFLGIPYAAPPVGDLRWRAPQPPKPWGGTLDATRFASACPQVTTLAVFAGPTSVNEDCLYLNVYTTGSQRAGGRKPVIVWIHGGANLNGAGHDYDGSKLATGGPEGTPTVVVTLNYRLGMFGLFSHPAINRDQRLWGNYVTLDHQAALRWVQRNIAAFGGDPGNVTIAGESSGATNVMVNVLSPLSKGLFHRAIAMSSTAFTAWLPTAESTQTLGTNFATAAGCPGSDEAAARCLRGLSAARILQVQGNLAASGPYNTGFQFVDGTIVPTQPEPAWSSGNFNKVPLIGGGTRDEAMFFYGPSLYFNTASQSNVVVSVPRTPEDYARATAAGAFCIWCNAERKMPPGVAEAFPLGEFAGDAMYAFARVGTGGARCRELHVNSRIAAHAPVYAYEFAYEDAPIYFPKFANYRPRAYHTGDLQFVFPDFHGGHLGVNLDQVTGMPRGLNAAEIKLSDQMVAQWTLFARSGNPNGSGNVPWPRFTPDANGQYLVQSIPLSTMPLAQFRAAHRCDFFDPQLKY